jgi:cob(I)alamin adenosyltransferase
VSREKRGLIIVYTGDGKGKTTAALGLAVRAVGAGLTVRMLQFIKGDWKPAELKGARLLSPAFSIQQLGIGFVTYKPKRPYEEHRQAAQAAWEQAKAEMASGNQDVLILDEINNAFRFNLLSATDAVEALRAKPEGLHVVLTGRGAPPEIIELADLVTEMQAIKHPYEKGVPAQYGIDF